MLQHYHTLFKKKDKKEGSNITVSYTIEKRLQFSTTQKG